jgi:phage tail-like protein
MSDNQVLTKWMGEVVARGSEPAKKTAAITCYDQSYKPVATFNFEGCWPSKLTASDLSASANEVMVEEITIQHQEIFWA